MNGTNKQRIIEHEVLHSKNIPCFQRKVLTPFFKGSSKGFFSNSSDGGTQSRIVESILVRDGCRGLCNDWERFRGGRRKWISVLVWIGRGEIFSHPCESRAWPMRFVAQSMKSILDASPLLWNVNWSFRRWSKCQTFNFYSLFLHTFSFYPSSRIIFTLHLEHWLFDRQMEREWIRRLVKSLGDLIFYIRIVIKSLQDSRELNIWNVELKCE